MQERTETINGQTVTVVNTDNRGYGTQHQIITSNGNISWVNDDAFDDED